jgi:hypothetical protein
VAKFKYVGTIVTNRNLVHEKLKNWLNSGNACYHQGMNYLSSRLLSRNVMCHVNPLLGNELLNELPRGQTFDKQSVAKLRNNSTVLCNPILSDGSVNRLPRRRNDVILQQWWDVT